MYKRYCLINTHKTLRLTFDDRLMQRYFSTMAPNG